MKRSKPKFGDVLEISTAKGFAYFQYAHHDSEYGALIRVLPGVFEKRPGAFADIVSQPERFFTFFPLAAAINRGLVVVVGNEDIPRAAQKMPVMRAAGGIDRTGKVLNWWILEGANKTMVSLLSEEQQGLSIAEIVNDTLLAQRIVEGWSPSNRI